MWNDSGLDLKLRGIMGLQSRYYLYGDLAYWPAFGIMGPHRQQDPAVPLSRAEESANLVMSSARIAVEWGFALNINYWGSTATEREQSLVLHLLLLII